MTAAMRGLAAGDKGTEIPARGRRDEVGEMAAAVQVFKDNMIRADELAAEQEAERVARARRVQRIEELKHTFDAAVAPDRGNIGDAPHQRQATATSTPGAEEHRGGRGE